jgi:acetyltransferase-like isoleucine patch superfamily enzyme
MPGFFRKALLDIKIYYRINSTYKKRFKSATVLSIISRDLEKKIMPGTTIEKNVFLAESIQSLGKHLYIGKNTSVMHCSSIGNFTSISSDVKIGLIDHPSDYVGTSPVLYEKRKGWVKEDKFIPAKGNETIIGNDVLISANTLVRSGVKIGNGAIVGAGSFVNADVPPYAIVAGVPAKIIRYRFEQPLIDRLLKSEWWLLDDETIRKAGNFNDPEKFLQALNK